MRKVYIVQKNDAPFTIAQKFLNSGFRYVELLNYNEIPLDPGIIYPGQKLLIPQDNTSDLDTAPEIVKPNEAGGLEPIIEIGGTQFFGWQSVSITRTMDTVADAFQFQTLFDPNNPPVLPFGYDEVKIAIGSKVIITGIIDRVGTALTKDGATITLSGRSKAGQLLDNSLSTAPYEFRNQDIISIMTTLCRPFGIKVFIDSQSDKGGPFEKSAFRPGETIMNIGTRLGTQRGLLPTSASDGNLLYWQAKTGEPVAVIAEGSQGVDAISATFDGSKRYGKIIVDAQDRAGQALRGEAIDSIVKDSGINRTILTSPADTPEGADLNTIAKWERGKRSADSMPVSVTLSSWIKPDGTLWAENEVVSLVSPSNFIYTETDMIVREVNYNRSNQGDSVTLSLILPSAYTLNDEEVRPWNS